MLRWLFVAALPMLAVAAACGGDDDKKSTPELMAYFAAFKQINADANTQLAQLDVTYPQAFKGDVKQTRDSFREYVQIFDDADGKYEALNVPADLRAAHDDVIAADKETSTISHRRLANLELATEYSQVDAIFVDNPDFATAVAHGDAACLALEGAAATYAIAFDLPCEK